jgi:hypothetical protein
LDKGFVCHYSGYPKRINFPYNLPFSNAPIADCSSFEQWSAIHGHQQHLTAHISRAAAASASMAGSNHNYIIFGKHGAKLRHEAER